MFLLCFGYFLKAELLVAYLLVGYLLFYDYKYATDEVVISGNYLEFEQSPLEFNSYDSWF